MKPSLSVKLCKTWDGKPLACVDLPGEGAELRPEQLRQLAAALLQIAADSEALPLGPKTYREQRREYALGLKEPESVGVFQPRRYTPDEPPRLRKPGESQAEYRVAMGWDAP
jgi:hypothetical protein